MTRYFYLRETDGIRRFVEEVMKKRIISKLLGGGFMLAALSFHSLAAEAMDLSAGEIDNRGVGFVLGHIKVVPPKSQLNSQVLALTLKFCRKSGLDCSRNVQIPEFPPQDNLIIAASGGSQALRKEYRALATTIRTAKDIPSLEASLAVLEQQAATILSRPERKRFSDAVSIASSSARLWAPVKLGGRGGGHVVLPPGGRPASDIDWGEVAATDVDGCIDFFLEGGCAEGAVAFSAIDILQQLNGDE
jgi:hypothetical protein